MQIDKAIVSFGGAVPLERINNVKRENEYTNKMIQGVISCYINKARYSTCEGCQMKYQSQKDHPCIMNSYESHVEMHFEDALRHVSKHIIAAIYAYQGKQFPNIFDWGAYIDEHKSILRINMEELLSGNSNEIPKGFNDFYQFVKEVL